VQRLRIQDESRGHFICAVVTRKGSAGGDASPLGTKSVFVFDSLRNNQAGYSDIFRADPIYAADFRTFTAIARTISDFLWQNGEPATLVAHFRRQPY
jgi:hypothetical protein